MKIFKTGLGILGSAVLLLTVSEAWAGLTTDYIRATATLSQGTSTNTGTKSAALGDMTVSKGYTSFAEGFGTLAASNACHAEGANTTASNLWAHAEGDLTRAHGQAAHAEGIQTLARGDYSHAEGQLSEATGQVSHAEGYDAQAYGANSHAGGKFTRVQGDHANAFIHATGSSSTNRKVSLYSDTAHFDREILFEASNNDSNSVLARWENDRRYGFSLNAADWNPTNVVYVNNSGYVGVGTNNALSPLHVVVTSRFDSVVFVVRQGDISMGNFTNGAPQ